MKQSHPQHRSVIINLTKTALGYQVDEHKKSENKKSTQLLKSAQRHLFYNGDSMHKSEVSDKESEMRTKHDVSYKVFEQNQRGGAPRQEKVEGAVGKRQIPGKPEWFNALIVDQREKERMGEFFKGGSWKSPGIYIKYRNFIVNTYELDPEKYLSKIACRRTLHGDAPSILRIHSFLEEEGVINRGDLKARGSVFSKKSVTKTPERQSFKKVSVGLANEVMSAEKKQKVEFEFKPNFTSKILSKTSRALCPNCHLPIGVVWYQIPSNPTSFLCLKCYSQMGQQLKEQYEKRDVTKHFANPKTKNKWQMEQHGKLLGSLAMEGIGWQELLERIPNKDSKQEIIFHFMQLPSANMESMRPPSTPIIRNNDEQMISLLYSNLLKSPYPTTNTSHPSTLPSIQKIQLSPLISQLTTHKLSKFSIQLQTYKHLDQINYHNSIIQNPITLISKARILKDFQADENFQNLENPMMMDSEMDMEPMNLGEDNFFNTDFNNDNFGRFDDDDDIGGIFNVLND